jgi:hypothetical protein
MKTVATLLLGVSLFFSACKKKEEPSPEQPPPPAPVQTGELRIKVTAHDSLGDVTPQHEGVKVTLQTGATATTNSSGEVTFTGLPYGVYAPSLLKSGFEAPPSTANLQSSSQSVNLPVVQHSRYKLGNLQCMAQSENNITLYFNLDNAVPQGKSVKIAVLAHTVAPTAANFLSADVVTITTQQVNGMPIAGLPGLKSTLTALPQGSVFYVSALPVAYGLYENNITVKPNILGESLHSPGSIQLIKNW